MSIISWNCQGLGNPKAVQNLHTLVKEKDPVLLFLMETRLDVKRIEKIQVRVGFQYAFIVPSKGRSRGLALLWRDPTTVWVQTYSRHHIDVHIQMDKEPVWRLTGFYGQPEAQKRHETWRLLKHLGRIEKMPWLSLSDFNEILS